MFFFEQTFQTVLNGIDGAGGPMGAITNIANAILLLCALFAVYEAYARGGDARMIGVAAAKFLILGLIVSNYSAIFRNVNGAFNQVAASISPNDWANNWMLQVNQYFNGLGNANWFNLVVSSIVALVSVLVQLIAAIVFPIALLIFTILYCLYGASLVRCRADGACTLSGLWCRPTGAQLSGECVRVSRLGHRLCPIQRSPHSHQCPEPRRHACREQFGWDGSKARAERC